MFTLAHKQQALLTMQGVGAGDIHRVNQVGGGKLLQRIKTLFDRIIRRQGTGLRQLARINGGQFQLTAFMSGIDKLTGDPIGTYDCETNHLNRQPAGKGG
ncbi:hypothetical protein SODG_005758 [Sodalis praecaptivus]